MARLAQDWHGQTGAEAAAALRAEAERTGRSQQDIAREALGRYLGLVPHQAGEIDPLISRGTITPPRSPFRDVRPQLHLRPEENSLDLLERDQRF